MKVMLSLTSQVVGYTIIEAASNILNIGIARGQPGRELARALIELSWRCGLVIMSTGTYGWWRDWPAIIGICIAEGGGHAVLQDGRNVGQRSGMPHPQRFWHWCL